VTVSSVRNQWLAPSNFSQTPSIPDPDRSFATICIKVSQADKVSFRGDRINDRFQARPINALVNHPKE